MVNEGFVDATPTTPPVPHVINVTLQETASQRTKHVVPSFVSSSEGGQLCVSILSLAYDDDFDVSSVYRKRVPWLSL